MEREEKKTFLHRKFHCSCDLGPWWSRISFKIAVFGFLPLALSWYLYRWAIGDQFASPEASFLLPIPLVVIAVVAVGVRVNIAWHTRRQPNSATLVHS